MNDALKQYYNKLENVNDAESIEAILQAKLEATSSQRVVDYVGLSVSNLEAKIERIKQAEKEMKALKAETQSQVDLIKGGVAKWLSESGVEKLDGDIVSSMKVVTPKASEELIITTDEDSLINQGFFKAALDKTAIKNAILNGTDVEGAHIEVTHKEDTITIYKKRGKQDES